MKTATSLTLVAVGAIIAFAITAHISWLNLQVIGWILILTGVTGAIITRSTWLRRNLVVKRRPAAATAERTSRRPPPSQRLVTGRRPVVARDAAPAEPETIEEYVGA
jgi:phosphate/sulfate permease